MITKTVIVDQNLERRGTTLYPLERKNVHIKFYIGGISGVAAKSFSKCRNVIAYRTEHGKSRWSQSIWSPEKKKQ